jgi:hypothetical protein
MAKQKVKTSKQVHYLFSSASPLTEGQKEKLAKEIRTGQVKVKK